MIALASAAGYRGYRKGLLGQVFELGIGFIGLIVGLAIGPRIADVFTEKPGVEGILISLLVVFGTLSIGQTVGFLIGHRFGRRIRDGGLKGIDTGLGSLFAVAVTLLSFWLVASMLIYGPSKAVARELRSSALLGLVNKALPDPPNVLAYLRKYLDTSGFPQVFAGLPPEIGPPVRLPTNREARRAVKAASRSTVRILVPACGGTQLGSGWVAAPDTVVTNAHVVAGGDELKIEDRGGEHDGTVVLFDPRTDIAIVHVEGLDGRVLKLDEDEKERGTQGATIGFPGREGGEQIARKAAVRSNYNARGRDIYGRSEVERSIYELQSAVRQGDSGGPFVLPNGDVAGVVFAASTLDGDTGYALTGAEVEDEIRAGAGRTEAVDTGDCAR